MLDRHGNQRSMKRMRPGVTRPGIVLESEHCHTTRPNLSRRRQHFEILKHIPIDEQKIRNETLGDLPGDAPKTDSYGTVRRRRAQRFNR